MDTGFNSFPPMAPFHQQSVGFEQFPPDYFHDDEIFAVSKLLHTAKMLVLKFKHRAFPQNQLLQYELVYSIKGKRLLLFAPKRHLLPFSMSVTAMVKSSSQRVFVFSQSLLRYKRRTFRNR